MQVAHSWLIKCKMDTCQAQQLSLTFLFAFSLEVTVTICLPVSFLCFWFLVKQLTRVLSLKNENEEKLMMCHIFNYLIKLFISWMIPSQSLDLFTNCPFISENKTEGSLPQWNLCGSIWATQLFQQGNKRKPELWFLSLMWSCISWANLSKSLYFAVAIIYFFI